MKKKLRIAVIFGGRSAEHEVSLVSASSVIQALDPDKYEIIPIGITHEGQWVLHENALELLKQGEISPELRTLPSPDPYQQCFWVTSQRDKHGIPVLQKKEKVDVIFPVLHGPFGEDGAIQGLFEFMNIPYVGAGVTSSAVGMDKVLQKQLFLSINLPIPKFYYYTIAANPLSRSNEMNHIESHFEYPIFVKPANLGSSVGISKAHNREELETAMREGFSYDRKIILEQGIEHAREIEVSVLGNDAPKVSLPGEVKPSREFYDYRAKYEDEASELEIPAKLSQELTKKIQDIAIKAYKIIDCAGMARVDFLLSGEQIFLSEVNTIPGFTSISMYPKLWEASGLSYSELLDELIRLAIERHQQRKKLQTHAKNISDWYRKD